MRLTTVFISSLVLAALGAGCGEGDGRGTTANDTTTEAVAAGPSGAPGATSGTNRARTGVIEIGGETWTLVPAIQCSVYPGPVVSIAGHAAGDEAIEIVIDYDAQRGPVGVRVEKFNTTPSWSAGRDDLSFEIDGNHVKGEGTFTEFVGGSSRKAQGNFDVTC
jgi:hypothetical protein